MPPRISSAPMARAMRGGLSGLSSYSPTAAALSAAPYPGLARGLVAPHASSPPPPPPAPRVPPSAVGERGLGIAAASGSPAPVTLSSARGSPAASSPLLSRPVAAAAAGTRPGAAGGLSGWKPPQFGRKAAPSNANPLIVLIFGCRGSGKTTQAVNVAERYHLLHLSSGDMFKEGKQPYVEVEQAVKDHFGPEAKDRQYNGIVLDRFVATGEMDAYYLQAALNVCALPVPIVFWLQLDPKEGIKRAQQRGDQKGGADHWRYVEQRAQAMVADQVYKKIGVLHTIDCNAIDARHVWDRIHSIINGLFPTRSRNIRLPVATPLPGYEHLQLLDDYGDFQLLTKEVHSAIGNTVGRTDSAPLSSIGGYVDATCFSNRNECKKMSGMYVTLKVDGQRFLVIKHSHFGVLGFPFLFTGCYDFNALFDPLVFPNAYEMHGSPAGEPSGIEWMLDAELSSTGDPAHPVPVLHIIDYVFFGGKQAKRTLFAERYELLTRWFEEMLSGSGEAGAYAAVVLKRYVPINELPALLPRMEDAPFAVDGLVFQANSLYKFGPDKLLLKWKPLSLCTADFRLMNGRDIVEEDGSRTTEFELYTTHNEREIAYPGATGVFTEMEVRGFQLRNSVIAELELETVKEAADGTANGGSNNNDGPPETIWRLHRLRSDKPRPNKTAIVDNIVNLKHLSYEELLEHCRELQFTGPAKN
uniref:RNA guanylyltransferase n=1 Tax=Crithidia fasciculata TaxID=5656 RepID=O61121_CRIFA|nr:RNA guanylyltransferase [Crithidia fasciculata]